MNLVPKIVFSVCSMSYESSAYATPLASSCVSISSISDDSRALSPYEKYPMPKGMSCETSARTVVTNASDTMMALNDIASMTVGTNIVMTDPLIRSRRPDIQMALPSSR